MPYELQSLFRLRVKDVKFHKPPNAQELSESRDTEGALGSKENPFVPMQVCACFLVEQPLWCTKGI